MKQLLRSMVWHDVRCSPEEMPGKQFWPRIRER